MSALPEIQQRINSTIALIAEHERAALRKNAPASLIANIRALEKQRRRLEREFEEIALTEEFEVCRYRLMRDDRPTLTAVTTTWGRFQELFSSIYDAIKNGPKKRGRIGKDDIEATQFGFGFTFSGSIGVALTLPHHEEDAELSDAIEFLFGMAATRDSETLAVFVEQLGVPPIVRFRRWVKAHTESNSGAIVEWNTAQHRTKEIRIQLEEFRVLEDVVNAVSEPKVEEQTIPGLLTGVSMERRRFEMTLDTGEKIRGRFNDAINEENAVTLPKHYQALIRKTTIMKEATEEEEVSYFLVRLGRRLRS